MDAATVALRFDWCSYGRFGGPPLVGVHAVVIALLRHRVTGAIICLMGALGFAGWALAYLP